MLRALTLMLLLAAPAQAGYLASTGAMVHIRAQSEQLEVRGGPKNAGAWVYYCAAAEAALSELGATHGDRLRIEGMPRGGTGALFTLLRDAPRDPGLNFLGRRGTTLSVTSARALCKY